MLGPQHAHHARNSCWGQGYDILEVPAVTYKFTERMPIVGHRCTGATACNYPLIFKRKLYAFPCHSLARYIRFYELLLLPNNVLAAACALLPAGQAGWRACTSPGSASPPSCSARRRSSSTPAATPWLYSQQSSAAMQNLGA